MSADYVKSLTPSQQANIAAIIAECKRRGITNGFTQAAILAIVSKETNFIYRAEGGYGSTDNARIRAIFSQFKNMSDAELTALKHNDEAFFNKIYGGRYGNAANEGYKYRGRGPNQLTFKGNYKSIGDRIGVNLVDFPDRVNEPEIAAKVVVDFYIREFETAKKLGILPKYNTADINGFKNATDSLNAVFQATRGWMKTGPDNTGGYAKAQSRIEALQQFANSVITTVKDNKGALGALFFLGLAGGAAYYYRDDIKKLFKN